MKTFLEIDIKVDSLQLDKTICFETEKLMWNFLEKLAELEEINLPSNEETLRDNALINLRKWELLNRYTKPGGGSFFNTQGNILPNLFTALYENTDELIQGIEKIAKENIQNKLSSFEKKFLSDSAIDFINADKVNKKER